MNRVQDPKTIFDYIKNPQQSSVYGTVIKARRGLADIQLADGSILNRQRVTSSVQDGDSVRVDFTAGSNPTVVASGAGAGNGSNTVLAFGGNAVSGDYVPTSRIIYLGDGILGVSATLASDVTVAVDSTVARAGWAVNVGAGMTGGGGLSAAGINIGINTNYAFTWGAMHLFNAGVNIAVGQPLRWGSDAEIIRVQADTIGLSAGDNFQSSNYLSGISGWRITGNGFAEFEDVLVRGTFRASVFNIGEISATAGSIIVSQSAAVVYEDFTTPATLTTFTFKAKNSDTGGMLLGSLGFPSYLRIKAWNGSSLIDVRFSISARTNNTTYTTYTATLISGTSTAVKVGMAIVDYGPSGAGWLTMSADGTLGASANLTIATHSGNPYTGASVKVRIGNLDGSYGITGNIYGAGIGDYNATTGNFLKYDTTNGFLMQAGAGNVKINASGIRLNSDVAKYGSHDIQWQSAGVRKLAIGTQYDLGVLVASYIESEVLLGITAVNGISISNSTGGSISISNSVGAVGITATGGNINLSASGNTVVITGSASVSSSATVSGGLNVGATSGAGAGQIKLTGGVIIEQAQPFITLYETDATANRRRWEIAAAGEVLYLSALNDAYSSGSNFMRVHRTGTTTIERVTFPEGAVNIGDAGGTGHGFMFLKNAATNGGPQIAFQTSGTGTPDWRIGIPGSVNSQDFFIFDNSSGGIGEVMRIVRATGATSFAQAATFSSTLTVTSTLIANGNLTGSSWSAATMDAAWSTSTQAGGPLALASKKFGDMVFVRGRVRRTGSGQNIGTLVSGHRPSGSIYRTAVSHDGAGNYSSVILRVQSSGLITIEPSPGTNPADIDCSMVFSTNS